jgi:signal transduction histidine kinase
VWRRDRLHARPVSVGGLVARFTAAGLVVMVVLAAIIAALSRQAATEQAVDAAREVTWISATGIAEPLLTDGVVAGDPAAVARFHEAMRDHVIQGSLVRVKVWTAQGRVVYADESRLIGRTFALDEDDLAALREGSTDSEISDLDKPENRYERPFEKLLEVYVGVRSTTGRPLLFEAYFRYDAVAQAGQDQWRKYAPPALSGLVVLQLVQIPVAWSLARRLQRQQQDRERLLQLAADSSGTERRRIAADLHDGIVQQLAGATYALDAARLGPADPDRDAALISETSGRLRACVGELRSLLVDIYPPDLAEEGLAGALDELAGRLERNGIRVDLRVDDAAAGMPQATAGVLFRSAQEILRNVASHSSAQHVELTVTVDSSQVTMVVDDDGRGFDENGLAQRAAEGHVGLRGLSDLVTDAGGTVTVWSAPGQGTRIDISVPIRSVGMKK